jgi:hypothetical protein
MAITAETKRTIKTLKDLTSEIKEVMDTIHINIDHQRAELWVCLPELGKGLGSLMEDHSLHVKLARCLASKLGDHDLVEEIEQEQVQLEAEVFKAFNLIDMFTMDDSCTEGQGSGDTTPQSYSDSANDSPPTTLQASCMEAQPCDNQHVATTFIDHIYQPHSPGTLVTATAGARTSSKLQVRDVSHVLVDTAEYSPPGSDAEAPPNNLQASCMDAQSCDNQHVATTFIDNIHQPRSPGTLVTVAVQTQSADPITQAQSATPATQPGSDTPVSENVPIQAVQVTPACQAVEVATASLTVKVTPACQAVEVAPTTKAEQVPTQDCR